MSGSKRLKACLLTDKGEVLLLHVQSVLDDRDTGVGNETGDGAHLLVDLGKGLLDDVGVSDITLPGLALDAVLLGEVGSDLLSVLGRVVDDGNVGVGLGEGLGDGFTDTWNEFRTGEKKKRSCSPLLPPVTITVEF